MASVLPDVLSGSPELSAGERTVSVIIGPMIAAAGAKPQPNMARLIEQYGAGKGLPDLRTILAGDCPRAGSVSINDRCGVHYPQLIHLGLALSRN